MKIFVAFITIWVPLMLAGQGNRILSRHFENYGQPIWSQINTFEVNGKEVNKNYQAFPLTIKIKGNSKIHVVSGSNLSRTIHVLNRNVFWSSEPAGQHQVLEKQILEYVLTIGSPLAKYEQDLLFIGLDNLEGNTYNTFKIVDEQAEIYYLLEKENDELRHIRIMVQTPEPIEALVSFQKYKVQNGLLTPTAIEITIGDQYKEWVLDEILLGIAIDDELFEQPNSQ
jgi:hypothetical protein